MAHFGANSVVYFNRNVRLFTARTTTVTVYCWRLTGSSYWGGGCDASPENFGTFLLFYLKWLILVQIQLHFNRSVRQFTAETTTEYVYCWRCVDLNQSTPSLWACQFLAFFWLCPLSSWPSAQTKHHKICDMVSKFRVSWILWPRIRGLLAQSGALKSSQVYFFYSRIK